MAKANLSGYRVLLLTSYCGGDNPKCSDDHPCPDCLQMCNVVALEDGSSGDVLGGLDYLRDVASKAVNA